MCVGKSFVGMNRIDQEMNREREQERALLHCSCSSSEVYKRRLSMDVRR